MVIIAHLDRYKVPERGDNEAIQSLE